MLILSVLTTTTKPETDLNSFFFCGVVLFKFIYDLKWNMFFAELRAEVEVIEQMSSSGSSSSDSASGSGSGDDSSSSDGEHDMPRPLSQTSPNRVLMANGAVDRQQGDNQLMNTLRKEHITHMSQALVRLVFNVLCQCQITNGQLNSFLNPALAFI